MKDKRLIYLFISIVVIYSIGMSFFMETLGFTFGIICLKRIEKLTKQLKGKEILEQDYKED